jgi:hypothetical protein
VRGILQAALFSLLSACATAPIMRQPAAANSAECSTIRLDQGEGPVAKLPIYNQALNLSQDPNLSYAIVSAELIDAYRFSHGESIQTLTSPLSVALKYRQIQIALPEDRRDPRGKVSEDDVIVWLVGKGFVRAAIESVRDLHVCDQRWLEPQASLIDGRQSYAEFLQGLLGNSKGSGRLRAVNSGLKSLCAQHAFEVHVPQPEKYPASRDKLDLALIHKTPVALGYSDAGLQANDAMVVGRRVSPDSGRCEYLMRESHGHAGSVWVDADQLMKSAIELVWLPWEN